MNRVTAMVVNDWANHQAADPLRASQDIAVDLPEAPRALQDAYYRWQNQNEAYRLLVGIWLANAALDDELVKRKRVARVSKNLFSHLGTPESAEDAAPGDPAPQMVQKVQRPGPGGPAAAFVRREMATEAAQEQAAREWRQRQDQEAELVRDEPLLGWVLYSSLPDYGTPAEGYAGSVELGERSVDVQGTPEFGHTVYTYLPGQTLALTGRTTVVTTPGKRRTWAQVDLSAIRPTPIPSDAPTPTAPHDDWESDEDRKLRLAQEEEEAWWLKPQPPRYIPAQDTHQDEPDPPVVQKLMRQYQEKRTAAAEAVIIDHERASSLAQQCHEIWSDTFVPRAETTEEDRARRQRQDAEEEADWAAAYGGANDADLTASLNAAIARHPSNRARRLFEIKIKGEPGPQLTTFHPNEATKAGDDVARLMRTKPALLGIYLDPPAVGEES